MNTGDIFSAYKDKGRDAALDAYRELIGENRDSEDILNKLAVTAADFAHPEALELLFEAGVSPSFTDDRSYTLLHHLADQHHSRNYPSAIPDGAVARTAELLLDKGVSALRKEGQRGYTCYHLAADNGVAEMVEVMAARGVKLNMTNAQGSTGIHIACARAGFAVTKEEARKKDLRRAFEETRESMRAMMDGEDPERYIRNDARTPEKAKKEYERAAQVTEHYFRVVKAFAAGGVDIGEKDGSGRTALDIAIRENAKKIAAFLSGTLVEGNGATVAAGGMTLHQAAEKDDAEAVKAIAAAGADINGLKDGEERKMGGCTPLGAAVGSLKAEAAEALLACGADPSFKDARGNTAIAYLFRLNPMMPVNDSQFIDVFSEKRITRIVKAIFAAGVKADRTVNDDEDTLLILACKSNCSGHISKAKCRLKGEVLSELMKYDPDVNIKNRFGETALMYAGAHDLRTTENLQIEMLEKGADTNAADRNGNTPLHYAAGNRDKADAKVSCDMLLEFGADANAVNNAGRTALDIAAERNNEPLVKLLLNRM
ncbi:MAG: ankyrin repeat domain-containing protein [Methanomassiliicoccaceae archaeon]|nr:ankyrin repeat domain-containing protein [Methanomassiliicoccaceae archaeon]